MKQIFFIFTFAMMCIVAFVSCSDGISSGSRSSASSCSGGGNVLPPPRPPTVLGISKNNIDFTPFRQLNNSLDIVSASKRLLNLARNEDSEPFIPAGTSLNITVDHNCTSQMHFALNKTNSSRFISEDIMSPEVATIQRAKPEFRVRDHSWTTQYDLNASEISKMIESDPCLVSISNNPISRALYTPNDTFYASHQAYLQIIKAPEGWDTFYGSNGITSDVIVAVIDDGTQISHPDLSNQLWTNTSEIAGNTIDDDGNGYIDDVNGYNFASSLGSPDQQSGFSHGTHVAGTIGAQENNSAGTTGIMGRRIKIMALNVFGTVAGASATNINNAINYAAAKGAKVINMSLGGSGTSASTQTAMQNAVAAGVTIVIAAGNSSQEITASNFFQPAGYAKDLAGALAVGSINAADQTLSSFSNYSTTYVEIAAPGSDSTLGGIYSTIPTSSYGYKQGTSMASPVVAGAAALAVGLYVSRGTPKTPAEIEAALTDSATSSSLLTNSIKNGRSLNLQNLSTGTVVEVCP